jgi:rod shape-determining protein MreC
MILCIVLMFLDTQTERLATTKSFLSNMLSPIIFAANIPNQLGSAVSFQFQNREDYQSRIDELERENFLMRSRVQRLTALEAENSRLRTLMQSSADVVQNVIIAEIISVNFDPYRHQITLNRGSKDGVYPGQSLLADDGIVGQVEKTFRNYSIAVLITDPSHTVPVQVNRSGLRALLKGKGKFKTLDLDTVPNYEDIKVGDLLVTSGLGGRFPRGYPVATVLSVDFNPASPFARITAKPTTLLDRMREVLLVVDEQDKELGSSLIGPFKTP